MARVRIVHWKAPEAGPLVEACRACGFEVEYDDGKFGELAKMIREKPPDALVIDLTFLPSHGREVAISLRRTKYARDIPLVFVDGAREKVDAVRGLLPDATFTSRRQLRAAVKSACAKRVANPVVPPGVMERYGSRTVAQKLGIKAGTTVGVIDAPRDYGAALGALPADVEIMEDPPSAQAVTLWFVRDPRVYRAGMRRMRAIADRTKLWVVWRKGSTNGLTQYVVRESAIEAGLVDYKICAVNEQWSAMALARRKS
jgi:CheY-like chemotaxis protein